MNPNRPANATIRPLASIPNKEGFTLVGVRKDGTEALLSVYMDEGGNFTVPGYADLVGWRWAS